MLRRHLLRWFFLVAGLGIVGADWLSAQESFQPKAERPRGSLRSLVVHPSQVSLDGPRDAQRIGVVGEFSDGRSWELSRDAAFSSSDPKVAVVEGGSIRPVV